MCMYDSYMVSYANSLFMHLFISHHPGTLLDVLFLKKPQRTSGYYYIFVFCVKSKCSFQLITAQAFFVKSAFVLFDNFRMLNMPMRKVLKT